MTQYIVLPAATDFQTIIAYPEHNLNFSVVLHNLRISRSCFKNDIAKVHKMKKINEKNHQKCEGIKSVSV